MSSYSLTTHLSIQQIFLNCLHVAGPALCPGDPVLNIAGKGPCMQKLYVLAGETNNT